VPGRQISSKLCSSAVVIRVINLGRVRWASHVARMREIRIKNKFLAGGLEGKKTT
jgi:hypothetical protein